MARHQAGEHALRGDVEGGRRLVEEPERAAADEEAGEGHAPPLPGREVGHGQPQRVGEAELGQGLARREGGVAQEVAGEGQVLLRRERALQPVPVPDDVQAFGQARLADICDREASRPRA